jgi:hypothetical protein
MLQISHAYAFIGGTFIGRFAGIIPSVILSGIMLYAADHSIFSPENINKSNDLIFELIEKIKL